MKKWISKCLPLALALCLALSLAVNAFAADDVSTETLAQWGLTYVEQTADYVKVEQREDCLFVDGADQQVYAAAWYGSFFVSDQEVEGNFVMEMTFKITSYVNDGRLLGLLFYYGIDGDGDGYGYAATMRGNGKTCVTGYSMYDGKTSPTFKDQSTVTGSDILNQVVTLRLAVCDGKAYVFTEIDGVVTDRSSYDLSKIALASGLIEDGENALTGGQIGILVSSLDVEIYDFKLQDYDVWVAADTVAAIDDLPDTVTYDDRSAVEAVRVQYDALTAAQQATVENIAKLEAAEETIQSLADAMVQEVVTAIDALATPAYTEEFATAIENAQALYKALPNELKGNVTNYDAIATAQAGYDALEAEALALAVKLQQLISDIDALPQTNTLVLEDAEEINALKARYDALSIDEQTRITNASKLTSAVEKLEELKNAPVDSDDDTGDNLVDTPVEGNESPLVLILLIVAIVAVAGVCVVLIIRKCK